MGRHAEAAEESQGPARTAELAGLVGGVLWVLKYVLPDPQGGAGTVLLWIGAVLLTVALFGLGMLLVKSGFLALRLFVGFALAALVWGVFALVRSPASDQPLVDAVFGAAMGVISVVGLLRRRAPQARGSH